MNCGGYKIDLGCGPDIDADCNVGVDLHDYNELYKAKGIPFKIVNFEAGVLPFCDDSAEYLMADNVLEHIVRLIPFLNECWRVLKKDCEFYVKVPTAGSEGSFKDPTHVRFFHPKTFDYFTQGKRQENYGIKPWIIKSVPVCGEGRIEIILTPDKA